MSQLPRLLEAHASASETASVTARAAAHQAVAHAAARTTAQAMALELAAEAVQPRALYLLQRGAGVQSARCGRESGRRGRAGGPRARRMPRSTPPPHRTLHAADRPKPF